MNGLNTFYQVLVFCICIPSPSLVLQIYSLVSHWFIHFVHNDDQYTIIKNQNMHGYLTSIFFLHSSTFAHWNQSTTGLNNVLLSRYFDGIGWTNMSTTLGLIGNVFLKFAFNFFI